VPLNLEWSDVALRLALAVVAGSLIGFDRGEHGRPAGLRTTVLVCLAACFAMLLANALLPTSGKTQSSFATFDVMRLPLGILTGIGFIGAGAIIRRDSLVLGVTTAATMWFVTVIGLCFGAGQIGLGLAGLALALAVLTGMKWLESKLPQDRQAALCLTTAPDAPTEQDIEAILHKKGCRIAASRVAYLQEPPRRQLRYEVQWRARPGDVRPPDFLDGLRRRADVIELEWQPLGGIPG
jgi:putative Mg2+ transporter-C (MgtC) family protein